jgi:prophage regulatory protein
MSEIIVNGSHRILRRPSVQSRTGLSRSSIYLNISKGTFPKPINLGARSVGWLESDIDNWIDARIQASASSVIGGCQ